MAKQKTYIYKAYNPEGVSVNNFLPELLKIPFGEF